MPEGATENVSREIEALEERLRELKKAHEAGREQPPTEKELLREAIGERIQQGLPLPPQPVPSAPPPAWISSIPPRVVHDELQEVGGFVNIAFVQDIPTAVRAVVKSGNAHLIDAFHDILVDRFYDELVKRGKLKG